jgi:Tfp pilus assembly protein PilF
MQQTAQTDRLEKLLGFLEADPENTRLLLEAAEAALDVDNLATARTLLDRLGEGEAGNAAAMNLRAVVAMRSGDAATAAGLFGSLREDEPEDVNLAFNTAWAHALNKNTGAARDLLTPLVCETLPQAAMLDLQLTHDAGNLEEAEAKARAYLSRHGDYTPLLAAISVLALDIEDEKLARDCAAKAGAHPDALSTMGMLTLGDHDAEAAEALFEKALAINPGVPRAWIGLGLSKMAQGDHSAAAPLIEKGAGMFGTHLGSWIAAGWAHLLSGDEEAAREQFEKTLEVDPNFAESHGSIAVLDAISGDLKSAKRNSEIALRLDRQCFSAALAGALIAAAGQDGETARRILELAVNRPIGGDGPTIAEALAKMGR